MQKEVMAKLDDILRYSGQRENDSDDHDAENGQRPQRRKVRGL